MIRAETISILESFLKPAVTAGLIPREEFREALTLLRSVNPEHRKIQKKLLTTKQAASLLACSTKNVHRMADRGLLRRIYLTPGNVKSLRWDASEIENIIVNSTPYLER